MSTKRVTMSTSEILDGLFNDLLKAEDNIEKLQSGVSAQEKLLNEAKKMTATRMKAHNIKNHTVTLNDGSRIMFYTVAGELQHMRV